MHGSRSRGLPQRPFTVGRIGAFFAVERRVQCSKMPQNSLREKSNFASRFNADSTVQPSAQKYFSSVFRKCVLSFPLSRLAERGVRVVTNVEAGCGGRGGVSAQIFARTNETVAYGKAVWSWRPDAGAKLAG
jgi:hypothetical protein